jgi:cellulose biosynthesis protein BcsQ
VIAVANTKGGAGKTPSVAGLASALGVERGGVVALDLWLRGNLGERTVSHGSTLSTQDFRDALNVLSAPDARGGDVSRLIELDRAPR